MTMLPLLFLTETYMWQTLRLSAVLPSAAIPSQKQHPIVEKHVPTKYSVMITLSLCRTLDR